MLTFGTDGIRGRANSELTMEIGYLVGVAAAKVLRSDSVLIGRDPRRSGFWLSQAVGLGFAAMGVAVVDVGVVPTGAVSFGAMTGGVPGVVVSASHNPSSDNGIKILGSDGGKLPVAQERAIEMELAVLSSGNRPQFGDLGEHGERDLSEEYLDWIVGFRGALGRPLRVVCDCAHGAATKYVPRLLARLGASVVGTCGTDPNGENINRGVGALHPEGLAELVVSTHADVGVAFDGDADRFIAITEKGDVVNGDGVIAILAKDLLRRHELDPEGVVLTVMANLGLERALRADGFAVTRCGVGDRAVATAMRQSGFGLGGEQSGHVIVSRYLPTGDGLVTATLFLHALSVVSEPLSRRLLDAYSPFPQVLSAVAANEAETVLGDEEVVRAIEAAERELGERGRTVVRASGTEPVVRVMVEAETWEMAESAKSRIVSAVTDAGSRLTQG